MIKLIANIHSSKNYMIFSPSLLMTISPWTPL